MGLYHENGTELNWASGRSGSNQSAIAATTGAKVMTGEEGGGNSGNLQPYVTLGVIIKF